MEWLTLLQSQLQLHPVVSMAEKARADMPYPLPVYQPSYRPPVFEFIQITAEERVDYFLVLDFKGVINKDEGSPDVMELIEFSVLKINAASLQTEAEFHTYVQPIIHPRLNSKCTEITGITQDMVDGKPILPDVLKELDDWMKSQGLLSPGVKFIFVTCGDWDLKCGLSINCDFLKLEYKNYLKKWINIKTYFGDVVGKKGTGMKSMLSDLGLSLDGSHHSGIDDSRNIAKILVAYGSSLWGGWVKPRILVRKGQKLQNDAHKSKQASGLVSSPSLDSSCPKCPREKVDSLIVLDFEATYSLLAPHSKEIIEFSAVKIDVRTREVTPFFHSFVQPTLQPVIPPFISKQNGISQDMVSGKPTLPDLLRAFDDRVNSKGRIRHSNIAFVTYGNWELKTALPGNCDSLGITYPEYLKRWVSLRALFQDIMGINSPDMVSMVSTLKLNMSGRVGGVNSDAINIAHIVVELMKKSPNLREGKVQPVMLKKSSDSGLRAMPKPRRLEKRDAVLALQTLPRFWFKELPKEKMDYFLVLDFEANENTKFHEVKEIIEFPVLKLNVKTLAVEATFHSYVQPTVEPNITPFITDLTGITQDMVKGQPALPAVLDQLHQWMISEGLLDGKTNFIFLTHGDWDLKTALPNNCAFQKLQYQSYLKRWINIKTSFQQVTGKKGSGMEAMLEYLRLPLDGRHHSGIDDSHNIAKMLVELMRRDGRDLLHGWVRPRTLMKST